MLFKAFISYSHSADAALAPALQSALEGFAKPWYRMRAFRVFRDTTNLSVVPDLWATIEKALGESEYMLILASPKAAESKWVKKELVYWRENKDTAKLLIILTEGQILWDDVAGDFDWGRTTALPTELCGAFDHEPLYLDFSPLRAGRLSLDDKDFLDHIATIAAALHGTNKDEIFGEHIRQHRRTIRLAWSAITVLFLLFIAAVFGGTLAYWQYTNADSRRLAALSEYERDKRLDLALLLAIEAVKTEETDEARDSLLRATRARPGLSSFLYSGDKSIGSLASTTDGKILAAGYTERDSKCGGIMLWTAAGDRWSVGTTLKLPSRLVTSVAFSPDGKTLAAGYSQQDGKSGGVMLWVTDGERWSGGTDLEVPEEFVASVAFSPDGKTLVAGLAGRSNGRVMLWTMSGRKWMGGGSLKTPRGHVECAVFSPDGKSLAAGYYHSNIGDDHGAVIVWEMADGKWRESMKFAERFGMVTCVGFSPGGNTLAACFDDNGKSDLVLWNASGGEWRGKAAQSVPEGGAFDLAFSADGNALALGVSKSDGGGGVVFWDVAGSKWLGRSSLQVPEGRVTSLAFCRNGTTLATGFSQGFQRSDDTGGVMLWNVTGAEWLGGTSLEVPAARVECVAFDDNGKTLAAGYSQHDGKSGGITLWTAAGNRWLRAKPLEVSDGIVKSVAFSPCENTLAAGTSAGSVMLWTANENVWEGGTPVNPRVHDISSLAFSPDGRTLAAGSFGVNKGEVTIWTVTQGRLVGGTPLEVPDGFVTSVAFSPDARTLAVGTAGKGKVLLWTAVEGNWVAGAPITTPAGRSVESLVFSRDGKFLAAGFSDFFHRSIIRSVSLWDVLRRKWLDGTLTKDREGRQSNVAFDRDGKLLAVGAPKSGDGGEVVLWDVARGEQSGPPLPVPGPDLHVAFHPHANVLAVTYSSRDWPLGKPTSGVILLPTQLESWIQFAGKVAGRNLSRVEWRQYFPDRPRYHKTLPFLPEP